MRAASWERNQQQQLLELPGFLMGAISRARSTVLPYLSLWRDRTDLNLTVLAMLYFVFCGFWACLANSYADRVSPTNKLPISEKYSAPDVIVDALKPFYLRYRWIPRNLPDILVSVAVLLTLAMCLGQKRRSCLVFRRCVVLVATLYLIRAPMIVLTVLPSPFHFCVADYDESIWWDTLKLMAQTRMSCGDVFFSGHTILFTSAYFVYRHNCPSRLLTTAVGVLAVVGMISLLLSTYHYTIDVLIGCILTGGLWVAYSCALEIDGLRDTMLGRVVAFWEHGVLSRADDAAYIRLPIHWANVKAQDPFRRLSQQFFQERQPLHYQIVPQAQWSPASKSWAPRGADGYHLLYGAERFDRRGNPIAAAVSSADVPRSLGMTY